jgi:predicted 2-oxoglutarate/Fe(II)-dependent dioxygenase YbiX
MVNTVIVVPDVISPKSCHSLIEEFEDGTPEEPLVSLGNGTFGVNPDIRKSSILWLPDDHWLTDVIWKRLTLVNDEHFKFDLTGHEAVQLSRYDQGGYYAWHEDALHVSPENVHYPFREERCRKLSCVLNLSASDEYVGGNLLLYDRTGRYLPAVLQESAKDRQGSLIVFTSWTFHCVTPVISGARYSAVMWAHGPFWR